MPKPVSSTEARRQDALRDRVRSRNRDLDEEQAQALADRYAREAIAEATDQGRTRRGGQ